MPTLTKTFTALIGLAVLAYLGAATYLYATQDSAVLPQTINHLTHAPNPALNPFTPLAITTPDGATLNGILYQSTPSPTTLILAFGGNAHDVVGMADYIKQTFPEKSIAVAGLSYRGYPNILGTPSTGKPSQQNLYADSELIYDTLNRKLHPTQTYAIGYSLGSSVATHLATVRPLKAIVLVTPPASIRRIAEEKYPWLPVPLLLRNPFPTEDFISQVTIPITMLYTQTDGLVPANHITQILHAAAPTARIVEIHGYTHGTIFDSPQVPPLFRQALGL